MNILIADDHAMVRDGIQLLLESTFERAVIHGASDFDEAIAICKQQADLDIIVLDLAMPGTEPLESIRILHNCNPATAIIVLSATDDAKLVRQTFKVGAKGFVPKASSKDSLVDAINLVLAGGIYIPAQLTLHLGEPARPNTVVTEDDAHRKVSSLTRRQTEILALIAEGKTNQQISTILNITETTTRTHVTAILKALQVTNRTQAGLIAARAGLTSH